MSDVKHTALRYDEQSRMLILSMVDGVPNRQRWYAIEGKKDGGPLTIDKAYTRTEEDARYIVTACNAYPALVEALEQAEQHASHTKDCLSRHPMGECTCFRSVVSQALAQAKGDE